jgi:hypothetical protein
VEYNRKSAALNLRTGAGSRSRTPAAAHSLNLRSREDHVATVNLQPSKDQAVAHSLNLRPGKDQAADVANLNL